MKKILTGIVTSNKNKDTVTVQVERVVKHPKYLRRYKRHKKYRAQTLGELSIGDKVEIQECTPISKDKKWKVVKLVEAGKKEDVAEEITEEETEEQKKAEEPKEETKEE